jgi:DNA-binding response OmpR family regulator
MPQNHILCISFDKTVSDTRCAALQEAGYKVVGSTDVEQAFTCLDETKFDLVIIGHRFSKNDKRALISEARQRWHTPVLLLCGASAEADLDADARVFAIEGIEGIMAAVNKLVPRIVAA